MTFLPEKSGCLPSAAEFCSDIWNVLKLLANPKPGEAPCACWLFNLASRHNAREQREGRPTFYNKCGAARVFWPESEHREAQKPLCTTAPRHRVSNTQSDHIKAKLTFKCCYRTSKCWRKATGPLILNWWSVLDESWNLLRKRKKVKSSSFSTVTWMTDSLHQHAGTR